MSAIRTPAARRSSLASYQFVQRAGLHKTIVARAGKESALGHEGRAEEIDREKTKSLKEQRDGKGSWKEGLASDSESIVKAERGEVEASAETIKKLQDEAKKVADKE